MENKYKFNLVDRSYKFIHEGGKRISNNKSDIIKNPLITIITVVKNGEKYLEEALKSVENLKFKNFEHIIIDGNSADKTIEIIKKYENQIDYWISDDDKGIYDGFNKGMQLAKGKYICFLNSDDQLTTNSLNIYSKYIEKYPDLDFIFGSVRKHWGVLHGYRPWKIKFSWGFYSSHSTGFLIRTTSAQKVGLYNLIYKYSSDYDFFYRMIVKYKMKGIGTEKDELVGHFRRGGFSSKIPFWKHFMEEIKIRIDNKQSILTIIIIFIYKFIKNINKII